MHVALFAPALLEVRDRRSPTPIQRTSHDGVPVVGQPLMSRSWCESGGERFVAVTQSTDLRVGVHIIRKRTLSFAPMLSARILIV